MKSEWVFNIRTETYFNGEYSSGNFEQVYRNELDAQKAMVADLESEMENTFEGYKKKNIKETITSDYACIEDTLYGNYCKWYISKLDII